MTQRQLLTLMLVASLTAWISPWWPAVFIGWVMWPAGMIAMMGLSVLITDRPRLTHHRAVRVLVIVVLAAVTHRTAWETERYQPVESGRYRGGAVIVADPEAAIAGSYTELALDNGARVRASIPWTAGDISDLMMGHQLQIEGQIHPLGHPNRWQQSRHLRGRIVVSSLHRQPDPVWWARASIPIRQLVDTAATRLPAEHRPLFVGLVIGDDRSQTLAQQAQFQAVGLTHLLAVSGQNVAFVLAVVQPLIERLGGRSRIIVIMALLALFAVVTRVEPSVLRATAAAMIAVWSSAAGSRASGGRALSLAVILWLIIDPFIVHSVGFVLSVAASWGIVTLGPRLTERLARSSGKTWWHTAVAVTVSAQIAVAPILILVFGPMSLISIPANLLAGAAAGWVMVWGMTAGLLAALWPASVGGIIMVPAHAGIWWLSTVASTMAIVPAPRIGSPATLGALGILMVLYQRGSVAFGRPSVVPLGRQIGSANHDRRRVWYGAGMVAAIGGAVLVLWMSIPRIEGPIDGLGSSGAVVIRDQRATVVILPDGVKNDLIEQLVLFRIRRIDVVITEGGGRSRSDLIAEMRGVAVIERVLAPPMHRVVGAERVTDAMVIRAGGTEVRVRPRGPDHLQIDVGALDGAAGPIPP